MLREVLAVAGKCEINILTVFDLKSTYLACAVREINILL